MKRSISDGPYLLLVLGHLNASSVHKITEEEVRKVLKTGSLNYLSSENSKATIASIFSEFEVDLLLKAARQAGGNIQTVAAIYSETLMLGLPKSPKWELFFERMQ